MRAVFERGIGCDRAVVLDGGALMEAHLELPGVRAGDVRRVRVAEARGRRGVVDCAGPCELEPLPAGAAEGGWVFAEVVREPVARPDRVRAAKLRPVGGPERGGPDLRSRLSARGITVSDAPGHGADALEAAGWSEALEEARTGEAAFPGGRLLIERTAAFEVIDVDGHLPAAELAVAAAAAVGAAVRRFDLAGSVVVDFPTPGSAAARRAADAALAAALPPDAERTAMNGFGLVQIVRPKLRPSLIDRVQGEATAVAALELLRRAERTPGAGMLMVTAAPALAAWLEAQPELLAELSRRTGRRAALQADAALAIWAGHVHG